MKRTVLATVALGALLTAAVPVFAQGGPDGPGGEGRGPRMERMMERMCEDRDARVAGALAFAETRHVRHVEGQCSDHRRRSLPRSERQRRRPRNRL